jgi:linoleoyl-CoA desaturase
MSTITFNNQKNLFFRSLKDKVDNYFINNNINKSGNRKLYVKSILQISSAIVLYTTVVFFTPIWPISVLLCALLGINLAVLGFNIMHEGGHASFSKHTWLNKASAYFLNAMGGNTYYWKIKHNINHHTFTNVEGMDSDIDIKPFMRLHSGQPRYWIHRFQHIYFVVFYGLAYFSWIFYDDFVKYFSGKISSTYVNQKLSLKEHTIFWTTKILYTFIFIVLPILTAGLGATLIGYGVVAFVCGLSIAIVFQLAHIVENTDFPMVEDGDTKIDQQWAIHQINTTSNFATKSKFVSWMLGGLNFQVEHHLFPKISHVHYPAINKFVKETCLEYNIGYNEYKTMAQAIHSHLVHIKRLGRS